MYERLGGATEFRALVHPLDAVLPRPLASDPDGRPEPRSSASVSREEVYANVSDGAALDSTYLALTILAAIVAAIGL
ncbi:MAG: TIGR00341 family protein, partial [Akkermansiaceae bacterium]|nr:TIGR00341 family protein [Akkermansiaceae bacterium]